MMLLLSYCKMAGEEKEKRKVLVKILDDFCKGCGICIDSCPKKCLEFSTKLNKKGVRYAAWQNKDCTACGICYKMCPDYAIEVYKEIKAVDKATEDKKYEENKK